MTGTEELERCLRNTQTALGNESANSLASQRERIRVLEGRTSRELDLAMAVRRLAARLKLRSKSGPFATPDNAMVDATLDLLKRLELEGSPLRDEPRLEQSPAERNSECCAPSTLATRPAAPAGETQERSDGR